MFETRRLYLKEVTIKDIHDVRESVNDPYIQTYVLGAPFFTQAETWVKNSTSSQTRLVARVKGTNEFVGVVVFTEFSSTVDIGGWVLSKFKRLGYAKEVYDACSFILFEAGKHKITGTCIKGNEEAEGFMYSQGFSLVVTLREHATKNGKLVDIQLFEKFK